MAATTGASIVAVGAVLLFQSLTAEDSAGHRPLLLGLAQFSFSFLELCISIGRNAGSGRATIRQAASPSSNQRFLLAGYAFIQLPPLVRTVVPDSGEIGSRRRISLAFGQIYAPLFNAEEIVEKLGASHFNAARRPMEVR